MKAMPIRGHMHREPPSFVDRAVGYAETAGKIYGAVQTMYHVGRAVGTGPRYRACETRGHAAFCDRGAMSGCDLPVGDGLLATILDLLGGKVSPGPDKERL